MSNDLVMRACRQQLETTVGLIEALADGTKKLSDVQLKAVGQACASAQTLQKQVAAAGDAQELWRLQNEWVADSMAKTLDYWRELYQVAMAAQSTIATRLSEQMQGAMPQAAGAANQGALLEMMDSAYKRWLETTRQFYTPPSVAAPQKRQHA